MMKNALFGGVNAAVLTPMRADLLGRSRSHGGALPLAAGERLQQSGRTRHHRRSEQHRHQRAHRDIAGTDGARHSRGEDDAGHRHAGVHRYRAADEAGADVGCRAALLLPPFYYKNPTEDGLFAYFSEVINRVGTGIKYYLYNFPQQSAVPFSVDLIGRLLKAFPGTLKGVKDSSGNYENGRAYVENFAKDGFEVYAGDDTLLRPLLLLGSAGCITAAANVNSPIAAQVYAN